MISLGDVTAVQWSEECLNGELNVVTKSVQRSFEVSRACLVTETKSPRVQLLRGEFPGVWVFTKPRFTKRMQWSDEVPGALVVAKIPVCGEGPGAWRATMTISPRVEECSSVQ